MRPFLSSQISSWDPFPSIRDSIKALPPGPDEEREPFIDKPQPAEPQVTGPVAAKAGQAYPPVTYMISYAVREGWLELNPVSLVKFDKENKARDRVLSPEEFSRLQSHSSAHLQAINLMAYQTGMRRWEILNLTWDRVDLKAGLIRLKAKDTKTDEARFVPLTADLTAQLKDLYKVRYLHEPNVFLVNGKSVHSIKTAFNAARRRAKIEGFRFHDFRHPAVSNMRRAGIDHLTIKRITGHKTMEGFRRYNSLLDSDLKEAAHGFNSYLRLVHHRQNSDTHNSAMNQFRRP